MWQQKFSYDQYNNVTKTGSSTWEPGYDPTTNHALGLTYDNNGNITNDTQYNYGWYVDNKLGSISSTTCTIFGSTDGTCILYDAFGREVERGVNGVYTEVMYTPVGKTAIMTNETTALNAYFPLPGGATYDQTGSTNGTGYFWHKDWLGSVRLSSSVLSRTFQFDRAFAPYGEMYDNFGSTGGLNFTGDTQDSFPPLLFDTPNRELSSGQGRWMSPDPSGLSAVNTSNPQTWNRYGYVGGNPLTSTDPTGLGGPTGVACRNSANAGNANCIRYSADCTQGAGPCPPPPLNGTSLDLLISGLVKQYGWIYGPHSPATFAPGSGTATLSADGNQIGYVTSTIQDEGWYYGALTGIYDWLIQGHTLGDLVTAPPVTSGPPHITPSQAEAFCDVGTTLGLNGMGGGGEFDFHPVPQAMVYPSQGTPVYNSTQDVLPKPSPIPAPPVNPTSGEAAEPTAGVAVLLNAWATKRGAMRECLELYNQNVKEGTVIPY